MTADYVATYNPAIICALIIGICLCGIVAIEARRRMEQEAKRNKRKVSR